MGSPLGVILEFGANSDPAQQDIQKLQQKVSQMSEDSAAAIERFSRRGIAAYEELQREYIRLGSQSANLRAAVLENEAQQSRLNEVIATGGSGAVQATAELQRLQAEHDKLAQSLRMTRQEFRAVSQASSAMMRENTLARENARSLASAVGIELPESIGHFIAQSKLAQETLAGLFNVTLVIAFASAAVEGVSKIIEAYHEWTDATEGQKKELEEISREQEKLLTHANTLAESQADIAETTRRLAELSRTIDAVRKEQESLGHHGGVLSALSPFQMAKDIGLAIRDHRTLNALLDEQSKLETRLNAQLKNQKELEEQNHKASEEAAKRAAEAAERQAEIYEKARQAVLRARVELPPFIAEIDRLNAAVSHQNSGLSNSVDILRNYQAMLKQVSATPAQLGFAVPTGAAPISTQVQAVGQLTEAEREQLPSTRELRAAVEALAKAYPQLEDAELQAMAKIKLQDPVFREAVDASIQGIRRQNDAMREAAQVARQSFTIMGEAVSAYGGTYGRVFGQVVRIIEQMIALHHLESATAVKAAVTKAQGEAEATGKVSLVKSVFETAEGIAALARLDFHAAALHFASSAKFLSVLGIVASAAGALGGIGGGSSAVSSVAAAAASTASAAASQGNPEVAPGTASANAASNSQQQTVQVIFQGPVYGGRAATDEIIQNINAAVKYNRQQLIASHGITGRAL
jgi:cell division protein FtsB